MSIGYNRFVWHDLMTTDTDAAASFYKDVAGWDTQQWEGGNPYTLFTNGGVPLGGMTPLSDEMRKNGIPPHWLPSVGVENVDATAAKATDLGGKVIAPPMDIPNTGRYAILVDPQGAKFSVFTPSGEMPGHEGTPQKGEFSWHELMTSDYLAAFDFYSKLFGWEKMGEFEMGPIGVYLEYGLRGQMYGGMFTRSPDMPAYAGWFGYIKVDDAKASADTITRLAGKIVNGPMEVPGGDWIAVCGDPQGAAFAVHSAKK